MAHPFRTSCFNFAYNIVFLQKKDNVYPCNKDYPKKRFATKASRLSLPTKRKLQYAVGHILGNQGVTFCGSFLIIRRNTPGHIVNISCYLIGWAVRVDHSLWSMRIQAWKQSGVRRVQWTIWRTSGWNFKESRFNMITWLEVTWDPYYNPCNVVWTLRARINELCFWSIWLPTSPKLRIRSSATFLSVTPCCMYAYAYMHLQMISPCAPEMALHFSSLKLAWSMVSTKNVTSNSQFRWWQSCPTVHHSTFLWQWSHVTRILQDPHSWWTWL